MESLEQLFNVIQSCPTNISLTKKYLTEDLVKKYSGLKTKLGGTLPLCIKHNAENPSALLPRCADVGCYELFIDFFDSVIRDYHQVLTPEILHPPSNFGDLSHLPFGDFKNDLVVSTRVRLGRTVKGFAFAPVITKGDRLELERKIADALKALPEEYAGTYYPLEGMSKDVYDQLVKDHFLFRDDDSVLRDAGGYRDWPSGRGIFINKAKNFLVWVNEEDHIRIISMQAGGNLAEVYNRLSKAVTLLSSSLEFAFDKRFGFLTFCPSNLGTTLRSSVHAKIPMVSSLPNYKNMCEKYQLQSRGTFGEHTATVGGVYDLSNKRRLGLTELQAVTEMATGVAVFLELEEQMQKYNTNMPPSITPIEPISYLVQLILDAPNSRAISRKYLTPDIVKKFEHVRSKYGCTLGHIIRNCAYNPRALCPRTGDTDCYDTFSEHLDAVIKEYHDVTDPNFKHPDPHYGDICNLPFDDLDPSGEYVISTRIRVGRSVEGFQFSTTINKNDRLKLEDLISRALNRLIGEHKGSYYSIATMEDNIKKQLIEDHFLFKDDDPVLRDAGGYRDWPAGRGIFHNASKTFLCWICEEDHLRIISMQAGGDITAVYRRLIMAINQIEEKLKFGHSSKYGYLTCCPSNLGTAMRASVHIRIPKLASKPTQLQQICDKYCLQARGFHGEHTESTGGIYDISNKRRLGLTEIDAATEMSKGIKAIIKMEASL